MRYGPEDIVLALVAGFLSGAVIGFLWAVCAHS